MLSTTPVILTLSLLLIADQVAAAEERALDHAPLNAAANFEWSELRGPNGNGAVPSEGWTAVEKMADAKLVWRNDELVPGSEEHSGGFASPVVAGGRVYLYYRRGDPAFFDPEDPHAKQRVADMAKRESEKIEAYTAPVAGSPVFAGHVLCVDVATGKTLWRTDLGPEGPNIVGAGADKKGGHHTACVRDGHVYLAAANWLLHCLDAGSGKLLWSRPLIGQEHAAFSAWVADVKSGKIKHPQVSGRQTGGLAIGSRCGFPNSCPTVASGVVAVGARSTLLGFDARTGEPRWSLPDCMDWDNSPVRWEHQGRELLLVGNRTHLSCVDPATGKFLWREEGPMGIGNGFTLYRDHVIVQGGTLAPESLQDAWVLGRPFPKDTTYQGMACYRIDAGGTELVWRQPFPAQQGNTIPVVHRGYVYTLAIIGPKRSDSGDGAYNYFFTCVDFATGDEVARINQFGKVECIHYKAVGDMVFVQNAFRVVRADPRDFRVVERNGDASFGSGCCHPAFAGSSRLVVRGNRHLYCYDLRSGKPAPAAPPPFRPNLALGKRLLASSNAEEVDGKLTGTPKYGGIKQQAPFDHPTVRAGRRFIACMANDGTVETLWRWAEDQSDAWLVVDIAAPAPAPKPRAIDRIVVEAVPAEGETLALTLSVGDGPDGPWRQVGKGTAAPGHGTVALDGVATLARFVRLGIAGAVTADRLSSPCGISEFAVYGPPAVPSSREDH